MDDYYQRPEVSNSGLTQLKKYFMPSNQWADIQEAYRFGTLIDSILTEPEKVNYNTRVIRDYIYTAQEFDQAQTMKDKFLLDPLCRSIYDTSEKQKVTIRTIPITYQGHSFFLEVRMKSDFEPPELIADHKSTACDTQQQFENSIRYFGYDRQAAWYMDITGKDRFIFLGQSKKKPYRIFPVAIERGDDRYMAGYFEYCELAFRHWSLF